jgi:CheY-like chemotaxis protein
VHDGERVHPAVAGEPGAMIVPRLDGLRVLAVDDDRDALELLHDILSAAGAGVLPADSAPAALATLEVERPDVIVADLGLPRMDGFELIARIRAHADPGVRRIPAAALTAYARSEDRARALRQGFQIHLAKPVDPSELLAAVASLGGRTGSRQEGSGSS